MTYSASTCNRSRSGSTVIFMWTYVLLLPGASCKLQTSPSFQNKILSHGSSSPSLQSGRKSHIPFASFASSSQLTPTRQEAVMMLDLDKTTIFGNDGNDFGLALQWMDKPKQTLDSLYSTLVSPSLRPAYEEMKAKTDKLDVVIYTRRPALLKYASCFRGTVIPLRYGEILRDDGQLYIPGHVRTAQDMWDKYCGPKLLPAEENDIKKSLDRLFSARDAVTAALELASPPTVVVTAQEKKVSVTVANLGLRAERAFLFDDNTKLKNQPNVVTVHALVSLPAAQRSQVLELMERELPLSAVEPGLLHFLLGAPITERAIERDSSSNRWRWRVPLAAECKSWSIPRLVNAVEEEGTAARLPLHRALALCQRVEQDESVQRRWPETRGVAVL